MRTSAAMTMPTGDLDNKLVEVIAKAHDLVTLATARSSSPGEKAPSKRVATRP